VDLHARQEEHHRDQRALLEAELRKRWVTSNPSSRWQARRRSSTFEISRRFPKALRRPVDPPAVSVVLRRMSAARRIHQVREGKPNHEALYTRGPQPPAAKRDDDR
jgi:hypothetical protein